MNSGSVAKPAGCHKVEHMGEKYQVRVNESNPQFQPNRQLACGYILFIVEVPATAMLYICNPCKGGGNAGQYSKSQHVLSINAHPIVLQDNKLHRCVYVSRTVM